MRDHHCANIEFARGNATGVLAPGNGVRMDSPLAGIAPRVGLHVFEGTLVTERDCLLQPLIWFKVENWHIKKSILEKDAAMKSMSTFLAGMEKPTTMRTKKELLAKPNRQVLSSATRKEVSTPRKGDSFYGNYSSLVLRIQSLC